MVANGLPLPLFFAGFLIISAVSFIDDLGHVPTRIRILAHGVAVCLLLWEVSFPGGIPESTSLVGVSTALVGVPTNQLLITLLALPVILGILNAYNFMDGINGITVTYSLVTIGTLFYLNEQNSFTDCDIMSYAMAGLLVFGFFNFRRKAICFAGDVGAVSIAYIILFLLLLVIIQTGHWYYIGLLLVYGVDSVGTIIQCLIKRENIFEAHRKHLYQLLANESHIPHVGVSLIYGCMQLLINTGIIYAARQGANPSMVTLSLLVILILIFAVAKIKIYKVFAAT